MDKAALQARLDAVTAEVVALLANPPHDQNLDWLRNCERLNRIAVQYKQAIALLDKKEPRNAASTTRR